MKTPINVPKEILAWGLRLAAALQEDKGIHVVTLKTQYHYTVMEHLRTEGLLKTYAFPRVQGKAQRQLAMPTEAIVVHRASFAISLGNVYDKATPVPDMGHIIKEGAWLVDWTGFLVVGEKPVRCAVLNRYYC